MAECCGNKKNVIKKTDPCSPPKHACSPEKATAKSQKDADCPLTYFQSQVKNSLDYAKAQKEKGKRIVGIMCEYTPRELIMAAGGVPVCLCGGSAEMVESAEKSLPSNLCPLIKSTFGYSIEKSNSFLEMSDLLVAETTCDGKKKMYELLAEKYPMHVLELPQKPNDLDAFKHWLSELEKLKGVLEKSFSTTITNEKLKNAVGVMNRERKLKRELAELMKADNPPLTGLELLEMKSLISGMPNDFAQYEKALEMFPKRTINSSSQPRVRVLLTGVPLPHGAERVMEIIEDNGGLVVCQENCTGLKPVREDIDEHAKDLIYAIAEKYFHMPCSVMTRNDGRMDQLRTLSREYRAQCIIELVWRTCITYDVESTLVKRLAEDELNLPYLRIETDYSPSDSARIALRVQSLFETINDRELCAEETTRGKCNG